MTTPRLGLESWVTGISQPNVPVNNNSQRIDALLSGSVDSRTTTAQPGAPDNGDAYIIPGSATGAVWSTFAEHSIAYYNAGTWYEYVPPVGLRVWVVDDGENRQWNGSSWAGFSAEGDVNGPGSATDNAIPRFDGTGGKTLQGSGIVVSDDNEVSGYRGNVNAQTGTTYTFVSGDAGKVVTFSNASAITVTLPNSLPQGWAVTWVQKGAGAVTFTPGSGAARNNRQSHTKSAGQWAMGGLYVDSNSGGASAVYVLGGDTAT